MNKKEKIITAILISFLLFGTFFNLKINSRESASPPHSENKSFSIKAVLEINNTRYEDEITEETTVYDFMKKLRSKGKINFKEKNYSGMGKFILEINSIAGDGRKSWIYYVNGKEAETGVSNYKLRSGDVVSWKLEKLNF